jgi:para-aminobenzoate synthetase component 1
MNRIYPSSVADHPERLWERSRFEWRLGQPGDPATLLEDFLAGHGLPVRRLADLAPASQPTGVPTRPAAVGPALGASLFVSAAAGARLSGAPPGAASPCPQLPDVVAVVWALPAPGEGGIADPHAAPPAAPPPPPAGRWRIGPWRASWSPRQHAGAVHRVRQAIGRGDVYQVNLVGHASAAYTGDPLPALRRLAGLPGARYGALLRGSGWAIGCASPETLVRVAGGTVRTGPIKGTAPATAAGRAALLASAKERAEHVMIVDLARNDLGRVAVTGSVRVSELYGLRRWCDLWQAESVVTARLADRVGLAQLLRAVCPPASVTGAPKRAALEQIAGLEPVGRGAAMGALGWVGHDGLDLGLTIRTVAAADDRLHLWAGGGITWGSEAADEVAEAAAKAAPLRRVIAGG